MMTMTKRIAIFAGLALSVTGMLTPSGPAMAQLVGNEVLGGPISDEAVLRRPRPEYDAVGNRVGSFDMFTSVDVGIGFDTNVRQAADEAEDFFFTIAPRLLLRSNWSRHQVIAELRSASRFFVEEDSENVTNADGVVQARLDLGANSALTSFVRAEQRQEARGLPEANANTEEPVTFRVYTTGSRFDTQVNRLVYGVGGDISRVDFEKATLVPGVVPLTGNGSLYPLVIGDQLNSSDRDALVATLFALAGFEVSPGFVPFVRTTVNTRQFDVGRDRFNVDRDSDGYSVVGGAQFELTNLLVGELAAGYIRQSYTDTFLETIDGVTVAANLEWYPSPLLTARATAARTIEDTIAIQDDIPASGRFDTSFGVGADIEVRRNLILSVDGQYLNNEFQGIAREDDVYRGRFQGRLLINRALRADLSYLFEDRNTDFEAQDFTQHQVLLNFRVQR